MKKLFVLVTAICLSLTISAKEVSKNSSTGMVLSETGGVYSISGPGGAIIIGDLKTTRNTMASLAKCFIQEQVKDYVDCGDQKYEVKSDDQGLYIIKVGWGVVKIRQSDVNQFLLKTESMITKNKLSKIYNIITE